MEQYEPKPESEPELILKRSENPANKETSFWSENPNILLNPSHLTELFPTNDMTYNQKLNAITRTIILFTVFVFFVTGTYRTIVFGILSVFSIYLVHHYSMQNKKKGEDETFTGLDKQTAENSPALYALGAEADSILVAPLNVFDTPTSENPFSNVLITDVTGNPRKKPAPPAYNESVNKTILDAAKEAVLKANPDQPDISDKLFKGLGEQMNFEQSMRQFYSTPSTLTPDDQQAFAEFCYGSMISCAEGNRFACARNAAAMRHTLI
jgi:hypothetical protein